MPHPRDASPEPGRFRPRYGRIAAAGGAALVTLVASLGGLGVLPTETARASTPQAVTVASQPRPADRAASRPVTPGPRSTKPTSAQTSGRSTAPSVPDDSGSGRRIVFDMATQRVWLVDQRADEDVVRRTYLVSGSLTDNLDPGEYAVYSKSRQAYGVEDSGSMRYMVRFARGDNAAIGFHDIPVLDGVAVQSYDDLGTPQSHGCIRQWRPDAQALWRFAPVGTKVVVV